MPCTWVAYSQGVLNVGCWNSNCKASSEMHLNPCILVVFVVASALEDNDEVSCAYCGQAQSWELVVSKAVYSCLHVGNSNPPLTPK